MVAGPLARLLAQIVVPAVAILARALPAAYAQALQNARKSGQAAASSSSSSILRKQPMSRTEALQILNLTEKTAATPEAVQKQYEKYLQANKVQKGGGSFYLQSKVYRAKEQLAEFQREKRQEEQQQNNNHQP